MPFCNQCGHRNPPTSSFCSSCGTPLDSLDDRTITLSAVDQTRSVSVTNGVLSARTASGTHTMSAVLPNGSWTITSATQGTVSYDANGVPTQGTWTITLPNNRIGISVVPGTLTVTLDRGPDGTIDRTWVFSTTTLPTDAG